MKILVINGPNLNMLSKRDPLVYGTLTLEDIADKLNRAFPKVDFTFLQSNSESEIIGWIQGAIEEYNGLIINPAAYSHYSYAIRDALELCSIYKIEVHLSQIFAREGFRHNSVTAGACQGIISGLKEYSYIAAADAMVRKLEGSEGLQ